MSHTPGRWYALMDGDERITIQKMNYDELKDEQTRLMPDVFPGWVEIPTESEYKKRHEEV